jgi:hypothetical protein
MKPNICLTLDEIAGRTDCVPDNEEILLSVLNNYNSMAHGGWEGIITAQNIDEVMTPFMLKIAIEARREHRNIAKVISAASWWKIRTGKWHKNLPVIKGAVGHFENENTKKAAEEQLKRFRNFKL